MDGASDSRPDDHDLIRRLLDETPDTPLTPAPRPIEPAPPEPEPEGATFLVHDDWDPRGRDAAIAAAVAKSRRGLAAMPPLTPAARHVARLAVFAVAVIGGAAGLVVAWFNLANDPLSGARALYDAAAALNAGKPLYPASLDPTSSTAYLDPPLLAMVLRPLALLGYEAFALVWEGIVVASFAGLVWRLGARSLRTWLAIGILGVPIGWALSTAQVEVPLTLLLAIGQPWSIGLAANLAVFPAILALWWLGRRDFQATVAFLLFTAMFVLVQVSLEPNGAFRFVDTVGLGQLGAFRGWPFELSLAAWLALVAIGAAATLVLARTRWGWAVGVAVVTLAPTRLLLPALTGLLAAVREPEQANLPEPEPRPWALVSGGGRH